MLFNLNHTSDQAHMLSKAEHRLGKEDQNCADAQGEKSILASRSHDTSFIAGLHLCQLWPRHADESLANRCLHLRRQQLEVTAELTGEEIYGTRFRRPQKSELPELVHWAIPSRRWD